MNKKRIVFLDDGKGLGGAEKNLLSFLDYLDKDLFEPLVVAAYKGKFFDQVKKKQIAIHMIKSPDLISTSFNIEKFDFLNPFALVYNFFILISKGFKLSRYLKKSKAEIIQTNGMFEHIYGGIGARLSGVPCVWFMQDIPRGAFKSIKRLIINFLAAILATKVVAVSQATQRAFYSCLGKKTTFIHVGIDIGKYLDNSNNDNRQLKEKWNCADSDFVIGMAGRLVYWKGAKDFLRAASIVSKEKNLKFVIIGDAIFGKKLYIQELKHFAQGLGIEDKVIFTGFLDNIVEGVNTFDIFVHCPFYPDPCPIGVMEAAVLKKAIVATRIGGIPEIIEDKKEGLLCLPADPDDLAEKITQLLESENQRKALSEAAHKKIIKEFSIQREVEGFTKIYLEILK